jgi:hypothetical protein
MMEAAAAATLTAIGDRMDTEAANGNSKKPNSQDRILCQI